MHVVAPSASISPLADIERSVRGSKLELGENVVIDSFVKIKFTGGLGDVTLGENSQLNSGCVLYSGNGITIGKNVLVAANVVFAPTNHEYDRRDIPINQQRFKPSKGGIVLEDDVWIGAGCVLLDGTIVRSGAIIGANSLVRGEVPGFEIYAGSPARRIGTRGT